MWHVDPEYLCIDHSKGKVLFISELNFLQNWLSQLRYCDQCAVSSVGLTRLTSKQHGCLSLEMENEFVFLAKAALIATCTSRD